MDPLEQHLQGYGRTPDATSANCTQSGRDGPSASATQSGRDGQSASGTQSAGAISGTGATGPRGSDTPPYVTPPVPARPVRRGALLVVATVVMVAGLTWAAASHTASSGSGTRSAPPATTPGTLTTSTTGPEGEVTAAPPTPSGPAVGGPSGVDSTIGGPITLPPGQPTATVVLTTPDRARPAVLEPGESWCPSFADSIGHGYADEAKMTAAEALGERNIGTIRTYTSGHPDEADVPWLDGQRAEARVVIGFTAHLADHRAALRALVADPDRLLVCQVRHSQAEVATVLAEIQARQAGAGSADAWRETSGGQGSAHLGLAADQEALAAELANRYGDLVTITVGNFPYPMPADPTLVPAGLACTSADTTGPSTAGGLSATLALDSTATRSGRTLTGTVTLTNTGPSDAEWSGGQPVTGSLVRHGTTQVVATFNGAIAGTGAGAKLQPGETHTIKALIGTDSCDPTVGYQLMPGDYDVIVTVSQTYPQTPGEHPTNKLVTAPVTVTITR